jgi:hypothetical protein
MGKKPRRPKPARSRWKPALAILLTLAIVGGIALAFDWIGGEALRRIGQRGRYRVAFADIHCDSPRGLDRETFLREVRYLSDFPESFHALDEGERSQLTAAFAKHPWVESVDAVGLSPGNAVTVKLTYRVPALGVRVDRGTVRLVDSRGILLPESDLPRGITELLNIIPSPKVNAGEVWPDETVQRSLGLMKSYPLARLERLDAGWRLTLRDGSTRHIGR